MQREAREGEAWGKGKGIRTMIATAARTTAA